MQTISFVSTFHKPVLDLYGQRFVDSFSKNVDKNIKFTLHNASEKFLFLNAKIPIFKDFFQTRHYSSD